MSDSLLDLVGAALVVAAAVLLSGWVGRAEAGRTALDRLRRDHADSYRDN